MKQWVFLAVFTTLVPTGRAADEQWVVVAAPAFREAVEPLCRHRRAQGFRVEALTAAEPPRERVARLCRDFPGTSYVLLVGAVAAADARAVVPPLPGTVSRMKGHPSDNGYGLPGEGLLPAVAVGRLPARTAEEAGVMVAKTIAYETDAKPGEWRRRLTVLAGAPEFNPLIDAAMERLAVAQLARIDPSWSGRAVYHNPQSRFSLPDDLVHAHARAYVEDGQALTLYLGHSDAAGFYANASRYLDRDDWSRLTIRRGPGIFATFGCLGCQLSGRGGEGYGVAAVRNPRGPAAVLGSHGVCFAAMVKLASEAFTGSLLGPKPPERLGAAWLRLKEGLAKGKIDALTYRLLDAADGDPAIPQAAQRQEHQEMFVLLGDPALRLPAVRDDLGVNVTGAAEPGSRLVVGGSVPGRLEGAPVRVTVERPRDSEPADAPAGAGARAVVERHERANDFAVVRAETWARGGRYEVALGLPARLPWRRLVVRAYAATENDEAMRCFVAEVKAPPP